MATLFAFISSIIWLGFVELLALGMLPFWSNLLSVSAEKALGYSRVLSLLTLSWCCWIAAQYFGFNFNLITIGVITLGLLALGHATLRIKFNSWKIFLYDQKIYKNYFSYVLILLMLIAFRACSPEIFWGEKPLEFSLFNYLIREVNLPAEHPWAAGSQMSYYYIGFFALAILEKVSMLDPSIGFNLGIAFTGATLFSCFECLLINLRLSKSAASLSAFFITFGANLNPVYLKLVDRQESTFDLFWLTTRNFTSPGFAEYPLWSFLFADLHPHVMAMPLVVCLLGLSWNAAFQEKNSKSPKYLPVILTGLLWGLLYSVNGWDFVSTAIALAILFGFSKEWKFKWAWFKLQFSYIALLALSAAATVLPFRLAQRNLFPAGWGFVVESEFNKLLHVFLHQGVALSVIAISSLGITICSSDLLRKIRLPEKSLFLLACFPLIVGLFCARYSNAEQAWHILLFAFGYSLIALLFQATNTESKRLRFCCLLTLCGAAIISMSESFYLIDRMNTIFKGYQILWPVFGVSAAVLLYEFSQKFSVKNLDVISSPRKSLAYCLYTFSFVFLSISFVGSVIDLEIMLPMKRTSNERFTLNGTSYLEKDDPAEAYLIRWLQNNVKGKAYIAEAHGDSYQAYSRVSMLTGLPTLLGWEYHSRQGGVAGKDIEQRKIAINEIFNGEDPEKAYKALEHYGIDFIFIGKLELEKYPEKSLEKFKNNPQYFIPVAWKDNYTLYLTAFSPLKK